MPVALCGALLLAACDDDKMDWHTPEGHTPISSVDEIPLSSDEAMANYKFIKEYMAEYMPGVTIGIGLGADKYLADENYQKVANNNFNQFVTGNAMKFGSVCSRTGTLNFTTVDAFIDKVKETNPDAKIFGHNLLWHTQQPQDYLRSLIAPQKVTLASGGIANELTDDANNFDGGTSGGWGSWGSNKESGEVTEGVGFGGSSCMVLINKGDGDFWQAQFAYTFADYLKKSDDNNDYTYVIRFKAKSSTAAGQIQFQYQNGTTYGSQGGYNTFEVNTGWSTCEYEFKITEFDDVDRIILNFGKVGGTYYIDDVEFGLKATDANPDPMIDVLGADGTFESGESAWGCWGGNEPTAKVSDEGQGYNSKYCLILNNPAEGGSGNSWKSQCAYTFNEPLEQNATYVISFYAKSSVSSGVMQFQYQNSETYGSQGGYHNFEITDQWAKYEYEFTMPNDDDNRILLNFGEVIATYYVDDIKFGIKNYVAPADPMDDELGDAGNFESGESAWGCWGGNEPTAVVSEEGQGYNSKYCIVLDNPKEGGEGNSWKSQFAYTFDEPMEQDATYIISFYAKSSVSNGVIQFQYQNATSYGSQGGYHNFDVTDTWDRYEFEFTMPNDDDDRILLNFGEVVATYYVDDIKFGKKKPASKRSVVALPTLSKRSLSKASTTSYTIKSPEEKQTALLGAMESWITEMVTHCKEKGNVMEWDVLNEAIGDDSKIRGVDGGYMSDDAQPTETETDGLKFNWQSDHFYWGYYLGKDYAVKAFQYARAAAGADAKLYINDYNLETSDSKLEALINYVKYIDETNGGAIVDGIGTQMHIMCFNTDDTKNDDAKAKITTMFTKLAATGKLVRISELDVAFSYTHDDETKVSPSAAQLQAQSDTYKYVIEQYKAIVPTAQQGGICVWSLTDADDEHEYWLKGDKPNLFNANLSRKPAYKGVCDGIAGKDLSADFTGSQWSN